MIETMNGRRILIADDEPSILSVAKRAAERKGYEVLTAADGQEAIDHLGEAEVDVVLTDVVMPNVDGMMVYQEATRRNVPVIFMSGYTGDHVGKVTGLVEQGKATLITKPFDLTELYDSLAKTVNE